MPDPGRIAKIEEPVIRAVILTPDEFLGGILPLLEEKRGMQKGFRVHHGESRDAHLRVAAE